MENKKISFGFSKVTKKTVITSKPVKIENKVELIDCLEGQSIKIKNAVEKKDELLVIPMLGSSNKVVEEARKAKAKRVKNEVNEGEVDDTVPDSELSIDELAARELIREAKNRDGVRSESKVFSLPLNEDKFVAEGAEEPSLDDYESVPISDYGMAMLRGMDWKEGMPIGRRSRVAEAPKIPDLRPKGLGLGANKMLNANKPARNVDADGRELQLLKGGFAKIIAGNHRGQYCEVQGFDDENCRIIVRTAMSKEVLNLNEFLLVPVSKEEYSKGSRVINNAKYEEYNEKSDNNHGDEVHERRHSRSRDTRSSSNSDRSLSRSRKKNKKKTKKSRNKSSSESEDERRRRRRRRRRKQKKNKSKNYDSSDSQRESGRTDRNRK